jgi:hypothetical protein
MPEGARDPQHLRDGTGGASILTKFDEPNGTFTQIRELSRLPEGRFLQGAMRRQPERIRGLPEGGPFILFWGTGAYRASGVYLSVLPIRSFEKAEGTRYFAGLGADGAPRWSDRESDAAPVVDDPVGDMSVAWVEELDLWLLVHDQKSPPGVAVRYAEDPWGPWSPALKLFEPRDGLGRFIHQAGEDDGLAGPVIAREGKDDPGVVPGGAYGPYVVERWTRVEDDRVRLYWLLSTWNPYVVVLMSSELQVRR